MAEVTRSADKLVCIEEDAPEGSTSASNQDKRPIRKAVAFSKQPAKADAIDNATPRPQRLPNRRERKHRSWVLQTKKTSEADNSTTLS